LEIHEEDISKNDNVLIVDDVLATGGTAIAVGEIVQALGGFIEGFWFLMDVPSLGGKEKIRNRIFADCKDYNDIEVVL